MGFLKFFERRKTEEFIPRQLPLLRSKKKEVKHTTGSSKLVFGLFFLSIVLSIFAWGWGKTKNTDLKNPATNSISSTIEPAKTDAIIKKLEGLTSGLTGRYGVYIYNLANKDSFGLFQDEVFTAASLIKLPVILTLYQEAEKGSLSLDTRYALRQEDKRAGAGSLVGQPIGKTYTYRQLAQLMGHLSDNTASAALVAILGEQKIQSTIDSLGMEKTSFARNEMTPSDMGLFFRKFYGGSIVSRQNRDEILSFITETAYEDRIPAGVPAGVRVAHKIGNEIGVFSDAGIVFADRPFVLVIMSKNALEKEARTNLPEITRAVWEFETN